MSVYAAYELCVDLNRDRDFSDANEDISAYWKSMRWQLGAVAPYDNIARASTLECVLNNSDGSFSPEHGSALSGFELGALIRLRSTYGATTRQHFIGWITDIVPTPGSRGKRDTLVRAVGFFGRVLEELAFVPVQQNKRYDEIITAILDSVVVYPPSFVGWLLGVAGFSELGEATYLSSTGSYSSLQTGVNTFNYAGDNWARGLSVLNALRDIMNTEGGFLFENRAGQIVSYNRHYFLNDMLNAVDATLTETQLLAGGVRYKYGQDLANDVTVRFRPRSVSTALETLATINVSITVPASSSTTTDLMFSDSSGNRIGGYGVVCIANTDYTAYSLPEGAGINLTANVTVAITEGGRSCRLVFSNASTQNAFITPGSHVRGYKVTDYGEQQYNAIDEDSIQNYGHQILTRNLQMLDDTEYARNLCVWELETHAAPEGQINSCAIQANTSDALMTNALGLVIGDRIAVSESQTGISSKQYHIVGEKHTVRSQYDHRTEWVLRPARTMNYWKLGTAGYSEIGETTRWAF